MSDRINFTDEVQENKLSTMEPQCMRDRPDPLPGTRPLTEDEVVQAKTDLVNTSFLTMNFPKVVRTRRDPPLSQQNYYVMTFVPSKGARPDADGCFGVMKQRGTFPTPKEAEEWSENLIRGTDSYNENIIGYVGNDFPLTLDSKYCLSTKEVDVRTKMDTIARDSIRSQRENDKKEMEEIQERRRELLSDTSEDKETAIDDLDYYVTLRVKRANIRILQEECSRKMKECSKILSKTTSEINNLDDKHPSYVKEYQTKYRSALDAIGGDTGNNKMIEYMK
ncbi:MAG: hypothetical protein PHG66_00665 [Candidatus Colwellbacteria bacterium]|nr:hypothetical protein [Candidatus Colwellbacteria bacterium]